MECITTSALTMLVNDKCDVAFHLERRIRWGDLISLYVFIICSNILIDIHFMSTREKFEIGTKITKDSLNISYLMFLDDSLVFCKATKRQQVTPSLFLITNVKCQVNGLTTIIKDSVFQRYQQRSKE